MQIFQDEYENTYYYANNKIYYWKGAGYECLTEMPSVIKLKCKIEISILLWTVGMLISYYADLCRSMPRILLTIG